MPKVAQYQPNQVQTQVSRQPRADASSGVAVLQSNINAAQGITGLVQAGAEAVQRVDTTSAEEALVQFERDKNELFFNPESGYFNTQGKNAYDGAAGVSASMDELKKRYGENLNQNARSMFDRAAGAQILNSQKDVMKHSSQGLKAWEVATVRSQVENTIENAALYWNQPGQLEVQNALGRQAVITAAEMEGVGAEATNERLQTFDSSFARTTIESATESSADRGQDSFDKYSKRLEGPDRVKLEAAIRSKAEAEQTQRQSQQAIANGARLADTFDSREDIRTEVNMIEDPDLRKKTMSEAMRQFNLKRQGESEAQGDSFEAAETHILEGGSAETFKAEDPEGWARLSAKQKSGIESSKVVVTDWSTYSDLILLPKDELAKIDPVDYFQELGPTERKSLVTAVKAAGGKGTGSQKADYQAGRGRTAQVSSAVEQILGKKTKINYDLNKANAFYDLLDGEVQHREDLKGGPLSSQEFTDALSDLTRNVVTERSFIFDFLVPDSDEDITDIPPNDLRRLSKMLRDNNVPVTIETLLDAQKMENE